MFLQKGLNRHETASMSLRPGIAGKFYTLSGYDVHHTSDIISEDERIIDFGKTSGLLFFPND
jgi:hypothetical protein